MIRSVRRSVSTSNGKPLGRVLETRLDRVERRLDGLDCSIGEVREWLALREGRERSPFWDAPATPHEEKAQGTRFRLSTLCLSS